MKVFIFICRKCAGVSYTRGNKNKDEQIINSRL